MYPNYSCPPKPSSFRVGQLRQAQGPLYFQIKVRVDIEHARNQPLTRRLDTL